MTIFRTVNYLQIYFSFITKTENFTGTKDRLCELQNILP